VDSQSIASLGKKVLVVDDDAVIIKTTSTKLKSQGYEVFTALDASEAMSAVRLHNPDLILLDVCFPPDVGADWDGLKLMKWLQRMDAVKKIPIIVVSGSDTERYKPLCLAGGAAAFFDKPVQYDKLLPFLAQVFQQGNDKVSTSAGDSK